MYDARDDWDGDEYRCNPNVHFRLYIPPNTHMPTVICVQDFDYPDYDARLILSPDAWGTESEAENALIDLIPEIGDVIAQMSLIPLDPDARDRMICRTVRERIKK